MSVNGGNDAGSTDPQVIPYLLYADAGAAIDWLAHAFGFTVRTCHRREDGTVRHGELQLDQGGIIMVGSPGPGYSGPVVLGGVTVLVRVTITGLDSHRDRVQAAGGQATEVTTGPPGWLSYSVTDPEGHQWHFAEPVPG
jgi:uncharacterized glyoxalase superfamily protein PhnB